MLYFIVQNTTVVYSMARRSEPPTVRGHGSVDDACVIDGKKRINGRG